MSLPKRDATNEPAIDALFRHALATFAEAVPPEHVLEDVIGEVQGDVSLWHRLQRWWISTKTGHRYARQWGARRLGKLVSWMHGSQTGYPPLPSRLYYVEPNGRCIPAPFAGVMVKQVLDLRLAS